ncbi:MAG: zinc-binding dehydrogenase [Anaerolineae bacterium]|nr:zinc-binding dehydrogenase [Anaerolineae bacterium]
MKYKSIVATQRGGPEVLQIVENELRAPGNGEARIRIQAVPVVQDDVAARVGNRPFLPKTPFLPGYAILGMVDAVGEGVTEVAVGDRVAALTNFGGYAEYIYWKAKQLVHVPEKLDPAEAVVLILNYLVPLQVMHTVVRVKPGDRVLIIGASGGVGTAFLQLGKLAGLKMYGLASPSKHKVLADYGAIPIDYHTQNFVQVLRQAEPAGLDYVFNGMGEEYFEHGLAVLRRGGELVHYGGPQSLARFLLLVVKFVLYNLLPNGKKIKGYGTHTGNIAQFEGEWKRLFQLLDEGKIRPIITDKLPILEARKANELLESGQVIGNIVLLTPELLKK